MKRGRAGAKLCAFGAACTVTAFYRPVLAAAVVAFAPAGAGQAGLGFGFDPRGALRAATCNVPNCSIERGTEIAFPSELRSAIPSAQFSVVGIGEGRRAIVVALPNAGAGRGWSAVVVAPLTSTEPALIFSGFTGFSQGEDGTRRGKRVEISPPDEDGARRIVIGDIAEDLSLCGRPALLAPELLSSADLKLHPAKVQRLRVEERERARHVSAVRVPEQTAQASAASSFRVLRAVAATSAVGSPAALTDGDPETTWAENRGGAGRGEFALLDAPPELAITALDFRIRPAKAKVEDGVAPREFWLASTHDLVEVSMPEDAWKFPGAEYRAVLDPPLQGDCLALVSESAFDESPRARVTFAELRARTEFDSASVPELVAALAGGGERAQAAEAVLRVAGPPGFDAVARAFGSLDEGGRRVALELLDQAPCQSSLPIYLTAFSAGFPAQRLHARDHIRRCGPAAAPYLSEAARTAQGPAQLALLSELLLADPAACVDAVVPLLDVDSRARRAALRVVLARASAVSAAQPRVRAALASVELRPRAVLEVLRALGQRLAEFQPQAGAALARVQGSDGGFRTRFLLIEPLAALASRDAQFRPALSRIIAQEPDAHLRARALSTLKDPLDFTAEVRSALSDPDVRVREAAVRVSATVPSATGALVQRLASDPWPLVRIAAADALANASASPETEAALARALDRDDSPHVRASVLLALGVHGGPQEFPKIRERLTDENEFPMVRAAAAGALAALCDASAASVDTLTRYTHKLADPLADEREHLIGAAALLALSELRPPDLARRLEPLLKRGAPPQARQAADAVLHRSGSCGHRVKPTEAEPAQGPAS